MARDRSIHQPTAFCFLRTPSRLPSLVFFLRLTSFFLLFSFSAFAQTPVWVPTNGPFGGQMRAVAVSPEGDFFAAARHTGTRSRLYRSTDHGVSYQELTAGDSISFLGPIYCGGGGLVLCGAAQLSGQGYIARSIDNGASWTTVPPSIGVSSFARDSSGNILCGADGVYGLMDGVFLSTDSGRSWQNLNGDLSYIGIAGVAFGRDSALFINDEGYNGSGAGVYRSTDRGAHWVNVLPSFTVTLTALTLTPSGTLLVGTGGSGVMRSTNDGTNWTPVVQGGPNIFVNAFSVDSTGVILMGSRSGIYRSTDDGASWTSVSAGLADLQVWSVASGPGDVRLAGNAMDVSQSTDGGETWREASRGIRSAVCEGIVANSFGTLVVATDANGGVYRSTDEGVSWLPVGGNLTNRHVYSLASARDGTIFAGVQADSGGVAVFRSVDQGATWEGVRTGMPNLPALDIATRGESEVVVVSNAGDAATGVFRSTDNGLTWSFLTTAYSNMTFWSVTLPPNGSILAGFYGGVIVSADTGRTWNLVAYGLPYSIVNSLACTAQGRVFATTSGFGVYYLTSDIAGPGWASADSGLPKEDLGSIQYLAADSAGSIYGTSVNDGVWQIPSGQQTWGRFASGLIDTNLTGMCFSPSGTVFVTTYGEGVFSTASHASSYAVANLQAARESGNTVSISWSAMIEPNLLGFEIQRWINSSAAFRTITPSVIPAQGDPGSDAGYSFTDTTASPSAELYRLRIISNGGSEHFSDTVTAERFTSVALSPHPLAFSLEQNYPNPFNPTTTIQYVVGGVVAPSGAFLSGVEGPAIDNVRLEVYDILGRKVAVLANGRYPPGKYSFTFDGSKLASGVYFVRLTAGEFAATRSMMLLR